jgi:NAD(P)-dependent dehydrogenase (short-subunit alcohol dehydrogenase family)
MGFEGKTVLVTGAGGGIGRAIALAFAAEGADVAIGDLNLQSADAVAKEVQARGRKSLAKAVDVTKKAEVEALVKAAEDAFGRLDVACNNAGVSTMNPVVDLTEEEWDFNMDVNAKGVFFCCQAEAKVMIKQGFGRIVNTASLAAKRGIPLLAHYAASKHAVAGFTKSLALELAPYKINVNCVCPGLVKTSMQDREAVWEAKLRGMTPDAVRQEYIDMTPLGRLEVPDDVAKVVVFLASDAAAFMTGQSINVTGGIESH